MAFTVAQHITLSDNEMRQVILEWWLRCSVADRHQIWLKSKLPIMSFWKFYSNFHCIEASYFQEFREFRA